MHKQSRGEEWFPPWLHVKMWHAISSLCLCVCQLLSEVGFEVCQMLATFVPRQMGTKIIIHIDLSRAGRVAWQHIPVSKTRGNRVRVILGNSSFDTGILKP